MTAQQKLSPVWKDILKDVTRLWLAPVWLTLMLVVALKRLIKAFPEPGAELNGDATFVYLPAARAILKGPWEFFSTDISSLFVVPLATLWPALWGANPVSIQVANSVLFLVCLVFMWRLTFKLGGWIAAMVSTALLATDTYLINLMPQVLTEPLYVFGLLLFLTSAAEYLLTPNRLLPWLAGAAGGLTITLMSRPVLQIFTLLGLLFITTGVIWLRVKHRTPNGGWSRLFSTKVVLALCMALLLPTAILVKNGVYFQYWGLGSGAGSGLQYGLSPFNLGMEPVFGGYPYDADHVPSVADPSTRGSPLSPRADAIMTQAAISVVKNTSLADNLDFFAFKLKAWLFGSPTELTIAPALRKNRTLQWMSIAIGLLMIAGAGFYRNSRGETQWHLKRDLLPNEDGKGGMRIGMVIFILMLTLGLVAQFLPLLYNTRYSLGFFDPLLIPLCAVSIAMIFRFPTNANNREGHASESLSAQIRCWSRWLAPRALVFVLLCYVPVAVTKHSERHKAWQMNPLRPGPTELALVSPQIGVPTAANAQPAGVNRWITSERETRLIVPLDLGMPAIPLDFMNGFWRFKLALKSAEEDRKCHSVKLQLSQPSPELYAWFTPEPTIHVALDGKMALYASRANGQLRPSASGNLTLTFNCPAGTIIEWGGAQLLKSTMAESARELIRHGTPINPYRPDDIR